MTDKPARVPHADRPTARDKCKCLWVHSTNAQGQKTEHLYSVHPDCKLHGDNVQPAPF